MKIKFNKDQYFVSSYIVIICIQLLTLFNSAYAKNINEQDRSRYAYVVDAVLEKSTNSSNASSENKTGSIESALIVYNKWLNSGGQSLIGQDFYSMSSNDTLKLKQLMTDMYVAAGDGEKSFKNMALLIQHGLEETSKSFEEAGYKEHKIHPSLSISMAKLRDSMIEDLILEIGKEHNYKVARSDSGNLESGMKSDLDQTFYVFEKSSDKKSWVRNEDLDEKFIKLFEQRWNEVNGQLTLEMLDVVSIEGKNRFPDPRAVSVSEYSNIFKGTIKELRNTPGAYTTFGAVIQQMQLRALSEIEKANKRAFQVYGPNEGDTSGDWFKKSDFNRELALNTMFYKNAIPELMKGHAFGAAVANYFELLKYMHKDKFETKYHLRTWEDCLQTLSLLEQGEGKSLKKEYTSIDETERAELNKLFLNKLFKDEKKKRLHELALEISRDLRLQHKEKLDSSKTNEIFYKLAEEMFKERFNKTPKDKFGENQKNIQIEAAKNFHRRLASEFCLESIYYSSKDAFSTMIGNIGNEEMISRTKHLLGIDNDIEWSKTKKNLSEASRLTLLYAIYDLGILRSADLILRLNADIPGHKTELFGSWVKGQFIELENKWDSFDTYQSLDELKANVKTHVISEFGFEEAESSEVAHLILEEQNLVWNWRKFASNMFYDIGTLDMISQIIKTFVESGGDEQKVLSKVIDELFLALPVIGQVESARRGGIVGLGTMALAIKFPVVGKLIVLYSIGEACFAVYKLEALNPYRGNMEDAIYRGFAGPELVDFGLPGRPPPMFTGEDENQLKKLKDKLRYTRTPTIMDIPTLSPEDEYFTPKELRLQWAIEKQKKDIEKINEEIKNIEKKREVFAEYQKGNWYGGLIYGVNSFEKQKWIKNYILKEIEPRFGFFTKSVVDLKVDYDPKLFSKKAESLQRIIKNKNTSIEEKAESLAELNELNIKKGRFEKAERYLQSANEKFPEIMTRFRRDSLYLYFKDKNINVRDFVDNWFLNNEDKVVEDLTAIGLKPGFIINKGSRLYADVDKSHLSELENKVPSSVKESLILNMEQDLKRSEMLYKQYKMLEEKRIELQKQNIEKSKILFVGEAVGKTIENLVDDKGFQDYLTALRYSSVIRMKPDFDVTFFKVPSSQNKSNKEDKGRKIQENFSLGVSVNLKTDSTLYYPPYNYETNFLNKDSIEKTINSGKIGKAILLEETKNSISLLINRYKRELEDDLGVIAILSLFSSGLPDLTHAIKSTIKDLPGLQSENNKQILLGQRVAFISSKPLSVKLDPIRIQVVDIVGNDIYDQKHADRISVTLQDKVAKVSKGEFWLTHEFTTYNEEVTIQLKYTMPDGEVISKEKLLSVNDIDNWYEPLLKEPIRFELPIFAPSSFTLIGKVVPNVQNDNPIPNWISLKNEALGINVSLNYKKTSNLNDSILFNQNEQDLGNGSFSVLLKEPVRKYTIIKLQAFANTNKNSYQGNKSLKIPNKPGTLNFEEIQLNAIKKFVEIPKWDVNSPPKGKTYIEILSSLGLNGKPKLGKPAIKESLQYCVEKTSPPEGSHVLLGSEVTVFLSDDYNRKVPDVRGEKVKDAIKILEKNCFKNVKYKLGKSAKNEDQEFRVETQDAIPESVCSPDKIIELVIYGKYKPSYEVPDLMNLTEEKARKKLLDAKLKIVIQEKDKVPNDKSKFGLIYNQKPIKNSKVGLNEIVYVWIYKDKEVTIQPNISPILSQYIGPQVPYYYAFQLYIPSPKDKNLKPKKRENESKEERRRRMKYYIDSLTLDQIDYIPIPIEKNIMPLHISQGGLTKYPREFFNDGDEYVIDIRGKNELVDSPINTCVLLRAVGSYSSLEELLAAFPSLGKKKDINIVAISNKEGTYYQTKKNSSYLMGPITKGWTLQSKQKGIKLLHLFNCFIASTIYYDVDDYKLKILRNFRDKILVNSIHGRKLVNKYYQYGPGFAISLLNNIEFKPLIKSILDKFVIFLTKIDMNNKIVVRLFSPLIDNLDKYLFYMEKIFLYCQRQECKNNY